jgi:hypothetical protein
MSEPVVKRRPMIDLDEFERRLRQPPPASKSAEDPLAELARLVGGQDDPYKAMFGAERPFPTVSRGSDTARGSDIYGREDDEPARAAREPAAAFPDPSFEAAARLDSEVARDSRPLDRAAEIGSPQPQWPAENYGDTSYPQDYAGEEPHSRRRLYLMAAVIVIGMAGIGASFVMKGARTGPQEIATIKAPEGPVKVAVEQPGATSATGAEVTVLERSQQGQRVGLVDTREQPVDLSQIKERATRVVGLDGRPESERGKGASGAVHVPVPPPPAQLQAAPAQDASTGAAVPIEPRKVKTVSVRPDGSIVASPPPSRAADVPLPSRRPATPVAPVAKAATPKIAERVSTTPKPVAAESQQIAAVAEATANPPEEAVKSGTYAVQLAAPESEQEARALQIKMMRKLGSELAGFHTSIRKAVVGDKTVYRVRVGNLSREEAVGLCQKIQSGGTACFVAKN